MIIQKYAAILILGMSAISCAMQRDDTFNSDALNIVCPVEQLAQVNQASLKQYYERKKDPVLDASDGYWVTSKKLSIFTVVKRAKL